MCGLKEKPFGGVGKEDGQAGGGRAGADEFASVHGIRWFCFGLRGIAVGMEEDEGTSEDLS